MEEVTYWLSSRYGILAGPRAHPGKRPEQVICEDVDSLIPSMF